MLYSRDTTIHIHAETWSTIMTNEHTSLEKYTSHTLFSKGLCVKGELETEQTATYWPQIPLSWAALLSHSASNYNSTNWLQLTQTLCGTGLYNCLSPSCFLWALHLHWIQPIHGQGYILISLTRCTCFSIDGWVEGQYVTQVFLRHIKYKLKQ